MVRQQQVEHIIQLVCKRDGQPEFLQTGFKVLLGRLLAVEADCIMQ
jgi:hypothetical protein